MKPRVGEAVVIVESFLLTSDHNRPQRRSQPLYNPTPDPQGFILSSVNLSVCAPYFMLANFQLPHLHSLASLASYL